MERTSSQPRPTTAASPGASRLGVSEAGGRRALLAALAANLAIAVVKCVAFVFTGSAVMLAETAHSLADSTKQLLLFVGRRRSRRSADPDHPLGYGAERYFWAFVVAILLFPLGALWAGVESLSQLRDPQPIAHASWGASVLLVALVFEAFSLRVAVRAAREVDATRSLWRFVRRSRDPDIPSVLLEDAGAVVGAALGLLFLGAALWTGDSRWDAAGGFAVAFLLLAIGAVLCVEFKSLLIGESALPEVVAAIARAIRESPHVRDVDSLRTLHVAPERLLVLTRICVDPGLSVEELASVVRSIQRRVRDVAGEETLVRVEPKPATDDTGEAGVSLPVPPRSSRGTRDERRIRGAR